MNVEICQGGSYEFNNLTLTEAGTHLDTVQTADGCDSIITLNLTVAPVLTGTMNVEICQGASYVFNNMTLTEAGTHFDTVQTVEGCDSIITLNLTVAPVLTGTMEVEICQGASYQFNNLTLTEAGTHLDTVQTAEGCDSIITLNLTVAPVLTGTMDVEICQGASYEFNNLTLTEAGTHFDTVQTAEGCDSIITLNLTVAPVLTGTMDVEICQGASYQFNNLTLTEAGTHLDTVQTAEGCDSIITLNLTVAPVLTGTMDVEICQGASYQFNNLTLTEAGTHLDTVQTAEGCDSIITLNLTVAPILTGTMDVEICQGASYQFNNLTLTEAGTHLDTVQTADGCDSIITLNLTVAPVLTGAMDVEICQGASYVFNNLTLTEAGTHLDTVQTAEGCDSIITLNLTVAPVLTGTMNIEICQGTEFDFNGKVLTEAGTYLDTVQTAEGCDSVITLILNLNSNTTIEIFEEICSGEIYTFDTLEVSEAGIYQIEYKDLNGCDSLVILDLTIIEHSSDSLAYRICRSESVLVNGKTYSNEGIYYDTLANNLGCDSVLIIDINFKEDKSFTFADSICENGAFNFNNEELTEAGTYSKTVQSAEGCDSVVYLVLSIIPNDTTTLTEEICETNSFDFFGQSLNTSGTYYHTLTSFRTGCDSIIKLDLQVLKSLTTYINESICERDTFDFHGQQLTGAGVYITTLVSQKGCDSIIELTLSIIEPVFSSQSHDICEGQSIIIEGIEYSQAGIYMDTIAAYNGCDSILEIMISIIPRDYTVFEYALCESDTFYFHQKPITQAGIYVDTIQGHQGCDSVVTLDLSIIPTQYDSIDVDICEGDTYPFGNSNYSEAGIYQHTFATNSGCDSVVSLFLTVIEINTTILEDSICSGDIYDFNEQMISESGRYESVVKTAFGCDSIVLLDLYIIPNKDTSEFYTICEDEIVIINGMEYNYETTFTETFTAANGCDSSVTYIINITPEIVINIQDTAICAGDQAQLYVKGAENRNVQWSPAEGLSCTDCYAPIAKPETTTTYTITVEGCNGTEVTTQVTVEVVAMPGLSLPEDQTIKKGETISVSAETTNPNSTIDWNVSGDVICADCKTITEKPDETTEYIVIATNEIGCQEEDKVIFIPRELYAYNMQEDYNSISKIKYSWERNQELEEERIFMENRFPMLETGEMCTFDLKYLSIDELTWAFYTCNFNHELTPQDVCFIKADIRPYEKQLINELFYNHNMHYDIDKRKEYDEIMVYLNEVTMEYLEENFNRIRENHQGTTFRFLVDYTKDPIDLKRLEVFNIWSFWASGYTYYGHLIL